MNSDGTPATRPLFQSFRNTTIAQVVSSNAWYATFGIYKHKDKEMYTFAQEMTWSQIHFKNHVDPVLHSDIETRMKKYSSAEQGGTLYFIILMDEILTSNENSLAALEGTIKIYNIASDDKDNLQACIKLIRAVCKTIIAMRDDGSHRTALPDRFVVSLVKVFQTTSVEPFKQSKSTTLPLMAKTTFEHALNSAELSTKQS